MIFPCLRKIFFLFMLSGKNVNATDKPMYNTMLSLDDLKYFLNAMENIVLYTERNITVLQMSYFKFGLFFSNGKHIVISARVYVCTLFIIVVYVD